MKHRLTSTLLGCVLAAAAHAMPLKALTRGGDPVVVQGGDLVVLLGLAPQRIVGFRYEDGWTQIPIQVDERLHADFGQVYGVGNIGQAALFYADASTFTGADTNTTFDTDDELVFMAADCGTRAPPYAALPAGALPGGVVELVVSDPLDGGTGHLYLFRTDATLLPSAGADYVGYRFELLCGPYTTCYSRSAGPNPEDSSVTSLYYRTHFSDRWIRDELHLFVDGAGGIDMLDRHRNSLGPPPAGCGRTEDSFSAGEGAFVANIDGPVRAIRSYLGSNSGPLTQRRHLFYAQRHDIETFLRVHGGIPGPMDLYDYNPAATGMTYFNDLNPGGATIDGGPDTLAAGALAWEMVTGPQGTLIFSHALATDIRPLPLTSYHRDDSSPSPPPCTGDALDYGASGPWINLDPMPNTDPALGATNFLRSTRIVYYDGPHRTLDLAVLRDRQARTPLHVSVLPFQGDGDDDGLPDAWEQARFGDLEQTGSGDSDTGGGDGVANAGEYVAGTDPGDPASHPALEAYRTAGVVRVSFTARRADGPGYEGLRRRYDLQHTPSPTHAAWYGVPGYTSLLGANQFVVFTNTIPDSVGPHFRTRIRLEQE